MYQVNLSSIRTIDRLMSRYSAAGCFRIQKSHGGSRWHYSGTFFWFRHSALFAKDWKKISKERYGAEGYLGRHIPLRDSFNLTPPGDFSKLHKRVVTRGEYRAWLKALPGRAARS